MKGIHDLPSPCALVDLDRLEANSHRMLRFAREQQVVLRPHVKTHKCAEIARLQCGGKPGPVTVSTLAEAERFADAGFRDITYAVPLDPGLIGRAAALACRVDTLNLLADHRDLLDSAARANAGPLRFFLKVDCGYHRAGVDPETGEALDLARSISSASGLVFGGILTHAGHSYRCRGRRELVAVFRQERDTMTRFAFRLEQAGIRVPEISIGSTPTLSVADDLSGITEVRPGNYVFHDRFQAAIGSCEPSDIAFTVLGSVIGAYPGRQEFLLNTGAMALSRDPGADDLQPGFGFGEVFEPARSGGRSLGIVSSISQEHAVVRASGAIPRIGERVLVAPNHSCLAAGHFERYYGIREGRLEQEFTPCRGW